MEVGGRGVEEKEGEEVEAEVEVEDIKLSDNKGRVEDDEEVDGEGKEEEGREEEGGREEGGREEVSSAVRMSTGIGTDSLSLSVTVTDSVTDSVKDSVTGSKEVEREVEEEGDGSELNVSSTVLSSLSLNAVATASTLGDRGRVSEGRDGGPKPVTPASESMVREMRVRMRVK